jgi:DHA3 family macrolide efflux protein-like MFS transporter
MVTRTFGEEVWRLTAHEAIFGFGSVIGGIIISSWGGFKNRIHTITLSCFVFGVLSIMIGLSHIFTVYLVIMFIIGIFVPFFNAPTMVFFQENVEQELQGRVFSFLSIVTTTAIPIGMLLFGPLADVIKIENILIVTGTLTIIISSIMYCSKTFANKF